MEHHLSHIAIATNEIDKARELFELLTNNKSSEKKLVESQKVNTSFIEIGDTHIELLEPITDDSPISNFLKKRGGGIHHLCIAVPNFNDIILKINELEIRTLGQPFRGAKGKNVVFLHPKDTFGVLIEIEEL